MQLWAATGVLEALEHATWSERDPKHGLFWLMPAVLATEQVPDNFRVANKLVSFATQSMPRNQPSAVIDIRRPTPRSNIGS